MIWILIALLFGLLLAVILFDADREEMKRSTTNLLRTCKRLAIGLISPAQRLLWWLRTHVGLLIAIAAGAIVTATGYLVEIHYEPVTKRLKDLGGAELLKGIENWAPHFGPELIVLAFAAIFVERALRKREQLRDRRFRTVQSLMYLVNYALQHQLYFDGGSAKFLAMEKEAFGRRSESRRGNLWFDERRLYDAAEKAALEFIEEGLKFARITEGLVRERYSLRADDVFFREPGERENGKRIAALEQIAKIAFRKVPFSATPDNLTIDDLLEEDTRQDWEDSKAYLLASVTDDAVKDRLEEHLEHHWTAIELRVELLKQFASFQLAVLSFRNRVWASDDPDE